MDGEKLQRGDKSKPVVWKIQVSQDLTEKVEEFALKQGISEAEVWRRAATQYLSYSKPRKRKAPAKK